MVVFKREVYAFKSGRRVSVCKYNFDDKRYTVKHMLSTDTCKDPLGKFSICYYAGKILLTGG